MGHATKSLEHAEHIGHAAHGRDGGHGHGGSDSRLPMWIGITMAVLGVMLASAAAKVGGERAELVKALVDQQHAHSKYQSQDIKHRMSVLLLRQMHATEKLGSCDPKDMILLAASVDRYAGESKAARSWVEAYEPAVAAHTLAQEEYELAQLAAEFGIVIASIALLLRSRVPWILSLLLGITAMGIFVKTYRHVHHELHAAEHQIEETKNAYSTLRAGNKEDGNDQALVDDTRATFGAAAAAATK